MHTLIFYGTTGCHLCEEAKALLWGMGVLAEYVDIASSNVLLENYGPRIPVLTRHGSATELEWPFDAAAVERFLRGG